MPGNGFDSNFFVVRKFENEDAHMEVEFLLDMLGNPGNSTNYQKNYAEIYENKLLYFNYNKHDNSCLALMSIVTVVIVLQAFFRLFYFM